MPNTSVVLAAVAAGGAVGASSRFLLGRFLAGFPGFLGPLPAGTLAANAIGCLAAGALMGWLAGREDQATLLSAFLMTGLLGGFTTFSAFSYETLRLTQEGQSTAAFLNVAANLIVSLVGVVLGWHCIQAVTR